MHRDFLFGHLQKGLHIEPNELLRTFALLEGTSKMAAMLSLVRLRRWTSSTTGSGRCLFKYAHTNPGFWISELLWNISVVKSSWLVMRERACKVAFPHQAYHS